MAHIKGHFIHASGLLMGFRASLTGAGLNLLIELTESGGTFDSLEVPRPLRPDRVEPIDSLRPEIERILHRYRGATGFA